MLTFQKNIELFQILCDEIMSQRHLLLLSNSTLHPTGYLEYAKDSIVHFLKENQVKKVIKWYNLDSKVS